MAESLSNPKALEAAKAAVNDAASQGGTCREGKSESPQRGADEQASGGRSGE